MVDRQFSYITNMKKKKKKLQHLPHKPNPLQVLE
jgi:hypothetical protein